MIKIDRLRSAERIRRDVETLGAPEYSLSEGAICRYAYTEVYRRTVAYFAEALHAVGFASHEDSVGTLVARNRSVGKRVFALGSHCDSVRGGGKWDGTLGVAVAVEVARVARETGLDLPLQVMSFLEEEGSGFGQVLLGSRIMSQRVSDRQLHEYRAVDDGRTFWEHAMDAGYEPARWRESLGEIANVAGWIETHIEQGRVLEDRGCRIGVVTAIAGILHADLTFTGRADHAGATPMPLRADAAAGAAEFILEVERLGSTAGHGTVATVGEVVVNPNVINAVPGTVRLSLDIRSADDVVLRDVATRLVDGAERMAQRRGLSVEYKERQVVSATLMDERIFAALQAAAEETAEPSMTMLSGGAHDTMCLADHIPVGMVFVPCKDGISHSPLEDVEPYDAAVAVETILNALERLRVGGGT